MPSSARNCPGAMNWFSSWEIFPETARLTSNARMIKQKTPCVHAFKALVDAPMALRRLYRGGCQAPDSVSSRARPAAQYTELAPWDILDHRLLVVCIKE